MATVSKRDTPAGVRWVADFRDHTGKRHMRFFLTKREADAELDEIKVTVKKRTFRDPATLPTFETVAREWLATQQDVARGTYHQWRRMLEVHLIPAFGTRRIDQVTMQHVNTWKMETWNRDAGRTTGKLARTTLNGILGRLRTICEYAIAAGYIDESPTRHVKALRKERRPDIDDDAVDPSKVLNFEQVAALLTEARPGLERAFLSTALYTGCRVGELLALRWSDLDLEAATLRVSRSLSWEPGTPGVYSTSTPIFGPPKTESSRRTMELDDGLVATLKAWWMVRPPALKADEALVFCNDLGEPFHRSSLTHLLHRTLTRAGLPRISVHGTRHTFASGLLRLGKPITLVADLLGHDNIDTTLKYYSHWYAGESNRNAMQDIAAAFRSTKPTQAARGGK